jgi:hypothetical protein
MVERSRIIQRAAPHPSPTGSGQGEESGAVCVSSLDLVQWVYL